MSVKTAASEHEKLAQKLSHDLDEYKEMARSITASFCILAAIVALTCVVIIATQIANQTEENGSQSQ